MVSAPVGLWAIVWTLRADFEKDPLGPRCLGLSGRGLRGRRLQNYHGLVRDGHGQEEADAVTEQLLGLGSFTEPE